MMTGTALENLAAALAKVTACCPLEPHDRERLTMPRRRRIHTVPRNGCGPRSPATAPELRIVLCIKE
jgi:hypothetical protein